MSTTIKCTTQNDLLLENYYISTEDICPNENLEDTDINYTFINDKLASIRSSSPKASSKALSPISKSTLACIANTR